MCHCCFILAKVRTHVIQHVSLCLLAARHPDLLQSRCRKSGALSPSSCCSYSHCSYSSQNLAQGEAQSLKSSLFLNTMPGACSALAGLFLPTQGRAAAPCQGHPQSLLTPNTSHNPQPASGQASRGDGGEPMTHHSVCWWLASVLPCHCTAFVQAWTLFYFQVHQGDQGEIPHFSCLVQQSRWRHDVRYHMLSHI